MEEESKIQEFTNFKQKLEAKAKNLKTLDLELIVHVCRRELEQRGTNNGR